MGVSSMMLPAFPKLRSIIHCDGYVVYETMTDPAPTDALSGTLASRAISRPGYPGHILAAIARSSGPITSR
jgi:hypothetical protein